jgi:hypothetical protein
MIIQAQASSLIARPLAPIFQYIAIQFFDNYPQWSPEVIELEALSSGPVQLGTQARQVRVDEGRRTESIFQVVAYQPLQRIWFESVSNPFYQARYDLEPVGTLTQLTFAFEVQLSFFLKPFESIITASIRSGSEQVVHSLKQLLEPTALPQPECLVAFSYESCAK